ncbi:hypothetical protein [Virgibacillus kimchii]
MKVKLSVVISMAFVICLFMNTTAFADSYPVKANLESEIIDDTSVFVTIDYSFNIEEETENLPFEAILFLNSSIEDIDVTVNGEPGNFSFEDQDKNLISGEVILDAELSDSSEVEVQIDYRVTDAVMNDGENFEVNIPVIASTLVPLEAAPGFFEFNVDTPEGSTVTGGFPSAYTAGDPTGVSSELQVMSSLISFEGSINEAPFFTFNRMIDFSVILLLIVAGAAAWMLNRKKPAKSEGEKKWG